jgi:hypothetical protein
MSTLLSLLTVIGILSIGFTIVLVVTGVFLWTRTRLAIDAAQHAHARLEATPAQPVPRLRVVARRAEDGRYVG